MEESSDSSDDGDSGRRSINDSESDCDEERSYSSGEPASKPPKTDEEDEETLDQLSALPDSLILQILSLLPMEEVVKTSALSKKWQYLWTSVDNLIFINKDYSQSERFEKFINFLEKTLSLSSCSTIRKFAVQFDYDAFFLRTLKLKDFWYSCDDDDGALLEILAPNLRSLEISGYLYTMKCRLVNVSSLVDANLSFDLDTPADGSDDYEEYRFALTRYVEDLDLNFIGPQSFDGTDIYRLPQHLFSNSSLTTLKLSLFVFEPSDVISWRSLKNFSLEYLGLNEDIIERILSGCPLLEVLELYNFMGFRRLDVTSPSLRTLKLKDFWYSCDDDDGALLEILAPNLRSLEISGYLYTMKCRLVNVSSLVDANLSFDLDTPADSSDDYEEYGT
ncbi:hypothetical protein F0562_018409 [Nyssa sinensis]|uniref:F-box domain-containing protein n=1 Tax=Nyssa sinensis TaxID=561372 RepID=A0A5J4ZDK4_9ASTE|nr:hypothetical protein F0562_018409 [Nyssa sinensis]